MEIPKMGIQCGGWAVATDPVNSGVKTMFVGKAEERTVQVDSVYSEEMKQYAYWIASG
jgi:hypothetical protein